LISDISPKARRWLTGAGAALLVILGLLAAFPWGLLRGVAEKALSDRFGRPVNIGALHRLDTVSFSPTIEIRDLHVPQAPWAGRGDAIAIRRLVATLPLLPVLLGTPRIESMQIDGMVLRLIRHADGRKSWQGKETSGGKSIRIDGLTVANSRLLYQDAKRDRSFDARLSSGPSGLVLSGNGQVRGAPVTLVANGAAVVGEGRWPFQLSIDGPTLRMAASGAMARPLETRQLDIDVQARAANLADIDAIIEAGLPRTQPVVLRAHARRDGDDWSVSRLKGTVGRSDIRGDATIRRRDGRHIIEADLRAHRFDFDDLADAEGRAVAKAKRARFGKRLFPDTAIDLDNVARTDGRLRVRADQLLWPGPSPFRSLEGTIRVEHSLLTIDDLRLGLTHGTMAGSLRVDQRKGAPVLSLDLALKDARVIDFAPDTGIDGRMEGRLRLTSPGRTIRAAIGRSSGSIGLVGRDGTLPVRTAALLGQDLLKGLFADKDELATLRCGIIRLDARKGQATAAPILIDTTRARTDMTGHIRLADERLFLRMLGTPKQDVALRLADPILINGTLKAPDISLPGKGGAVGAVLKSIGRAIDGKKEPIAEDADCDALARKALAPS